MATKKLIEVALPLERINSEAVREKSIRKGHPSTLHLWWARRPLASARAVIWSSLVDDPSAHPDQFPTDEDQKRERQRLFKILEDLVIWENSNNQDVLNAAKAEIIKSMNGNLPKLLDPFAGGGTIPLEAQRLGLESYAHDLNPVAVMINKAMIDIPSRFSNQAPVNKNDRVSRVSDTWLGTQGLAADIQYYGDLMKEQVFKKISPLYPKIATSQKQGGDNATVIAWIWTRTVKCPNPACGCMTPLVHTFDICKKKGKYHHIHPIVTSGKIDYVVKEGLSEIDGTVSRKGARCLACDNPIGFPYIREEGQNNRLGKRLMCIVAEGKKGRIYLSPTKEHEELNDIELPSDYPDAELPYNPRNFQTPIYGLTSYAQLFTARQLHTLTAFCDSVQDIINIIEKDAVASGKKNDHLGLSNNGAEARAYAEAVGVYLAFAVDKMVDYHSTICIWHTTGEKMANTMRRQAIQMTWDFAESNPMCKASGCFENMLNWVVSAVRELPSSITGHADQWDAHNLVELSNVMVSTDPPYYSNIIYADVSDYFYIWMRRSLKDVYPELFSVIKTPKKEELVAAQYRFGGDVNAAKDYFEEGMNKAFSNIYRIANDDIPLTVFYAYKQSDTVSYDNQDETTTNSGWETMLTALINSGFLITGTWPMRTELITALKGNVNALASSIVLVCRKRSEEAGQITRRNIINILRRELRPALVKLQESNIAPVDLAQSAIGPGMGVFSRYRKVLEADGTPMTVRSALQIINEEIDLYFNEQVGNLDAMSRFCVDLYTQNAFNNIKFGEADVLARAKGTSVASLTSHDVVYAKAGTVHLIERTELPEKIDENEGCIWLLTQQLTQAMATGGVEACAKAVFAMFGSNAERAKDLAYRLYTIAEQKKWASEAFAYNALVVAWPDIQSRAAMMQREKPEQLDIFKMGLLDS